MFSSKVLITGANSGLGSHLVKKFTEHGHEVFSHQGKNHFDLRNQNDIINLCQEVKDWGVDVLINNAAIVCPSIGFEQYEKNKIQDMIQVNLLAPILLTHELLAHLKSVININSMVGLEVKSPRTLYSASKWGLRGFSNSLREEKENLHVLDVYPTNIKTAPDRINAMDVDVVVSKIYQAFSAKENRLILDGRPK
jgi:short-subunit dehydrogenase